MLLMAFLAVVPWLVHRQTREAALMRSTPGHFAVKVRGLPLNATSREVREFFSKYGPVHSVTLIYDTERLCQLQEKIWKLRPPSTRKPLHAHATMHCCLARGVPLEEKMAKYLATYVGMGAVMHSAVVTPSFRVAKRSMSKPTSTSSCNRFVPRELLLWCSRKKTRSIAVLKAWACHASLLAFGCASHVSGRSGLVSAGMWCAPHAQTPALVSTPIFAHCDAAADRELSPSSPPRSRPTFGGKTLGCRAGSGAFSCALPARVNHGRIHGISECISGAVWFPT